MNKKGYIIIGIILVLIVFAITCSKIISNKEKIDKDYGEYISEIQEG